MASSARHALARTLGRAAGRASQLAGLGGGTTVGGRITLALDPNALRTAAAGRDLAVVSGTNGKTTTRTLLVAALRTNGTVVSNDGGANLPSGLVAALTADRISPLGVLEVDEPYLPAVVAAVRPRVAVLLNLTRDQLDRYAEVRRLAGIWRSAVPAVPVVVANADDPLVVWAAEVAPAVRWVGAGLAWRQDAVACPACGDVIRSDGAGWSSGCGLRRPEPAWVLTATGLRDPAGVEHPLRLALPGAANRGNAALAAAAAAELGVPPATALPAIAGVAGVEGRYVETRHEGRLVRLLLAKNPAGWQEALSHLRPAPAGLVVAVNARAADGRDPAWLWDVPFEALAGRPVIASGERSRDVAVRLRYAGVEHERVDDLRRALAAADGTRIEALGNYTAFQQLRRVVRDAR
ncbi:MAG TPA: MurT ligase domain-containing protein [Mycobacteriales bacterium]|nr:MurT ligase domain-containing protein [Mycobacteriales bacterium]